MIIILADVDNFQSSDFSLHREKGRSDYLFVLYKSPVRVLVNGSYTDVGPGKGIMFDKHKIQSYYPSSSGGLLHDFIHFDLENDFEKMLFSDIPLGLPLDFSLPDTVSDAIACIKKELNGSFSKYKNNILTNLGIVFLYRVKDSADCGDINIRKRDNFKNLYNIRTEIYRNPQREWDIDSICGGACMSRSYLQHLYREFFGMSCTEDIISARITKAKSLLLSGNLKVGAIAEKCGYRNTTHFIKQFKNRVGMSPDKYRSE